MGGRSAVRAGGRQRTRVMGAGDNRGKGMGARGMTGAKGITGGKGTGVQGYSGKLHLYKSVQEAG